MSENYCPSCGLQKSYGRTLAYYPDGPDLNKNICSKCGQTLMSADAAIATLQAQVAQLRAALEEIAGCRGNFGSGIKLKERARAALDALAREALKEKTDGK